MQNELLCILELNGILYASRFFARKVCKDTFLVHLSSLECFCCRLDQLAEAQSLAEDFQSMQRALRSLFSETERKLNAVDIASADNVEAMQNQLHEAKVSLIFAVYCFGL